MSESKDPPEVGRHYRLEDAASGTLAQNSFFHLLIDEWDKSGCSSYDDIREDTKRYLGRGSIWFYWNGAKMKRTTDEGSIPIGIREDPDMCWEHLISWTSYNLDHRKSCIDKLIRTMIESGVNSKRFEEIVSEVTDR